MQETQETWLRSLGGEDPQELEMAPPSSSLDWILWTEEPSRLQSMGPQRAGHDSACTQALCTPGNKWHTPDMHPQSFKSEPPALQA